MNSVSSLLPQSLVIGGGTPNRVSHHSPVRGEHRSVFPTTVPCRWGPHRIGLPTTEPCECFPPRSRASGAYSIVFPSAVLRNWGTHIGAYRHSPVRWGHAESCLPQQSRAVGSHRLVLPSTVLCEWGAQTRVSHPVLCGWGTQNDAPQRNPVSCAHTQPRLLPQFRAIDAHRIMVSTKILCDWGAQSRDSH